MIYLQTLAGLVMPVLDGHLVVRAIDRLVGASFLVIFTVFITTQFIGVGG